MNINGIEETKYPSFKNMSRTERDQIIFQQLEILANEVARISRIVAEIKAKI